MQQKADAARNEDEGIGKITEMMQDAEVAPRSARLVEEKLLVWLAQANLGDDELDEEYGTCFEEDQAYNSGIEEDRR